MLAPLIPLPGFALLFSLTRKSNVPPAPKSAPSTQGQASRVLLNAGKTEVGRDQTRSLDLMGRACSSDQIIINNWVWGRPATSMHSTCALRVPVGRVPSQGRRTGEWS